MYSYRVEQAIRAASVLHRDQLRKGEMSFPYITHLIATMMILLDYTDDEDIIIAALLHDTLEDTDYTFEELREDFGAKIAEIVLTLTEPKTKGDVKLTWLERKQAYAAQLKTGSPEALMVAAADKTHNFRTIVEEYYHDHNRFLQDFGKHLPERLQAYQTIANVINRKLENPIVEEFNHVFNEYKEFLAAVENTVNHV